MKINSYIKESISRQFVALICFFILLFVVGAAVLVGFQKSLNDNYISNREKLVAKRTVVQNIEMHFNNSVSNARGYYAFNNESLKELAQNDQEKTKKLIQQFDKITRTDDDRFLLNEMNDFYTFYFEETMPKAIAFHEAGNYKKVMEIANTGGTAKVEAFKAQITTYLDELNKVLEQKVTNLSNSITKIQIGFLFYTIILLILVTVIGRIMVKRIGKPLSDFAYAANEIAKGNEAEVKIEKTRKDELATLSIAFSRMYQSIQEKENDLLTQNEELIAQQDELYAQQTQLEDVLKTIRYNEETLYRRNRLINDLSSSFNKEKVLDSIIKNMCNLMHADRGIIVMMKEEAYAGFGISMKGAQQFKDYLYSDMYNRLEEQRIPIIIKRHLEIQEKGYHEEDGYVYDLYIPVFSAKKEIIAIMMLSRFSDRFTEFKIDEFITLAKQIGISLDKIHLFEQTEKDKLLNQEILNNVQEGIQLVGINGEILQVNSKFCDMMGYHKNLESLAGKSWHEWTNQLALFLEGDEALITFIENSLGKRSNSSFNTYPIKKENKVINVYAEGLYRNEEKFGTVFVYRDVTKEFEVDKMKSEFVSTVSHELRTPLASILGFTELMINRELKEERQKKYLSTIYGEAKRLTDLINDFLDVQRMESGKQTYEKKYIEILPIIEKIVENQQINAPNHEINIVLSIDNTCIVGDKLKVEQAFTNIISNAIKYSPKGGPIEITIYKEQDKLNVSVKDCGLGIPEEEINKLFSKFYRVDNTDRRKIGGTGLGLAIVQEIMKAHGGEASVKSKLGKGSTFTLSFPYVSVQLDDSTQDGHMDKFISYKIMVVEDDYSLAELMIHELKDFGFQVQYFKSGKEALEKIGQQIPDAIVLDIMLEEDDVNGWEIMKQLKKRQEIKDIPIVISTALDEKEKGYSLGAMDYLVKPYRPSELSRTIMQTLLKMGKIGQVLIPDARKKDPNSEK
ncbi:ATP-binding protein [Niallia sp. 03133]|uniref:ATP-binding protein n=1 Tax=Niallia sp. 03133 TaxID=3458060 RepID=UPI00404428E4